MLPDGSVPDVHPKDFMQQFFHDGGRDADLFNGNGVGSAGAGGAPPQFQPLGGMQVNMDVLESFMAMQDTGAGQSTSQPNPQALMEQQLRLSQLQQLQQLQNQIFQQQIELLSGQNNSFTQSPLSPIERQRDAQQYGLPTPVNSTELRAQQSTDFVSPMILQTSGAHMRGMPSHGHAGNVEMPDFEPAHTHHTHMLPAAPHSAPANLVFQNAFSADLDFADFSPLTSPILGAYGAGTTQHQHRAPPRPVASGSGSTPPAPPRNKRPPLSSSGDESAAPAKPPRKRPPPAPRPAPKRGAGTQRGTRSANSTPLFQATAAATVRGEAVNDTPSPIELPTGMPPPTHVPSGSGSVSPPPSQQQHQQRQQPQQQSQQANIIPVTPASMLNLGRLGINSALAPPPMEQGQSGYRKEAGTKRAAAKSGASAESKTGRAANVPLVSPSLKPIRPAGNAPAATATSPAGFSTQPVMQFRKSSHKVAEQKRRDSLKTSFDDLRVLLPQIPLPSEEGYPDEPLLPGAMPPRGPPKGNSEGPNRGVSKLQLLRCGNEYLRVLKARVERRDDEIARLRAEVRRLRVCVPEDAATLDLDLDLERDMDAVEAGNGSLFARAQAGYAGLFGGDDADEEGG